MTRPRPTTDGLAPAELAVPPADRGRCRASASGGEEKGQDAEYRRHAEPASKDRVARCERQECPQLFRNGTSQYCGRQRIGRCWRSDCFGLAEMTEWKDTRAQDAVIRHSS